MLTRHARERMTEMGLDELEVIDAVENPERTEPDRLHADRRLAIKGRLRVVYAPDGDRTSVCTVLWHDAASREEGPKTPVPNLPSNRAVYDQLRLWGCTPGRRRPDRVRMRTPTGQLIDIRPPGFDLYNTTAELTAVYRSLGVTAERFWAQTMPVRWPRERSMPRLSPTSKENSLTNEAKPKSTAAMPSLGSQAGRVLAYYRAHPNEIVPIDQVAEAVSLHRNLINAAQATLVAAGLLERVTTGRYRWSGEQNDADRAKAAQDLAWVTDPANRPVSRLTVGEPAPRPRDVNNREPRYGETSAALLDYYQSRPGETIRVAEAAAALGVDVKTATNAIRSHCQYGRLTKTGRGLYLYSATNGSAAVTDDPIEQLRQLAAAEPEPAEPEPEPAPAEPAPVPVVAPAPVVAPVVANDADRWLERHTGITTDNLDDEIDALFELLVPNGIKARHLDIASHWCDLTRALLRSTRPDPNAER